MYGDKPQTLQSIIMDINLIDPDGMMTLSSMDELK